MTATTQRMTKCHREPKETSPWGLSGKASWKWHAWGSVLKNKEKFPMEKEDDTRSAARTLNPVEGR